MDPGTALGVVSLAFQLVAGCVEGFVLLSEAGNIGKVGSELICLLNIQEARLLDWADRAGLLGEQGRLDSRLNAKVIEDVLGHLNGILGDVDKLSLRYNFSFQPRPSKLDGVEDKSSRGLSESLVSNTTRLSIIARANQIKSVNSLPKRLWWAAVDRSKFVEMIKLVQSYVQELWHFLDPLTQDEMMRRLDQLLVHSIQRSTVAGDMETLRHAIDLDSAHGSQRGSDKALITNVAALKKTRLDVGDLSSLNPGAFESIKFNVPDSYTLDFELVSGHDGVTEAGMASYDGQSCFVEFRRIASDIRERSIILKRIKNLSRFLVAPKHSVFRCLRCRGVAISPDESKVFFVFALPHGDAVRHFSLASLVRSSQSCLPSLGARLRLAVQLLESLRYLHASGWLHRNISSEKVVFFSPSGSNKMDLAASSGPYLVGFAYARLDVAQHTEKRYIDEAEKWIYLHPDLIQDESERSKAFMDVYSVGSILVELGIWKPLRKILQDVVDVRKSSVTRAEVHKAAQYLQQAILDDSLKLAFYTGDTFTSVAAGCLNVAPLDITQTPDFLWDRAGRIRRCVV